MAAYDRNRRTTSDWVIDRIARSLIAIARVLPYAARGRFMGWLTMRVFGPLTHFRSRAEEQLRFIWPEMDDTRVRQIANDVLFNAGQSLIEQYSPAQLLERSKAWQVMGEGWEAAEAARKTGRPILFVSAHFGNFHAARGALNMRGYEMGGLYRPMNNGYFNDHYVETLNAFRGPAFPRGQRGLKAFLRHVRGGKQCAILLDQYFYDGTRVSFLGKPAPTALTGAELALRYEFELIPIYARRIGKSADFDIILDAPIPHSSEQEMTQAIATSLERQVEAYPEQWYWVHRRWKPARQKRYFDPIEWEDGTAPEAAATPETAQKD